MKTLSVIVCLGLSLLSAIHAAPPDRDKSQPAARAKPAFRFRAYDGDPRSPKEMNFQVNCLGLRQPNQFLKLGDTIVGTKFKVSKFEFKDRPTPEGRYTDVSELTLTDSDTKETVILILGAP